MTKHLATRIAEALISSHRPVRALARVAIWLLSFSRYARKATTSYMHEGCNRVYQVSALDTICGDQRVSYAKGSVNARFKARYLRGLVTLPLMR